MMCKKKNNRPVPTGRAPGGVPPLFPAGSDPPVCRLCRAPLDGYRSLAELGLVLAGNSDLSDGDGLCLTCRALRDTYRRQFLVAEPHLAAIEDSDVESLGQGLRRASEAVWAVASDRQIGEFVRFIKNGDIVGLTEWVIGLTREAGIAMPRSNGSRTGQA